MIDGVLFVDDEPNVLAALRRQFRNRFPLWTAESAKAGLEELKAHPEIGIVVSDMRMPLINGAQFLAMVRTIRPDTVRFVLTGQADVEAAITAVNAGAIFRFLRKPCSPEDFDQGLEAAFEQRRLVRAERDLLENTLSGAVEVLAEVLELANPTLFSRSFRILRSVEALGGALEVDDRWELRVSALLSQIGCLAVAPETVSAVMAGGAVTEAQSLAFGSHPEIARKLLARIPRLEVVAEIVAGQLGAAPSPVGEPGAPPSSRAILVDILGAAVAFDQLVTRGHGPAEAVAKLVQAKGRFSAPVVGALPVLKREAERTEVRAVTAAELVPDMVLEQDVRSREGVLLVAKGKVVTETVVLMLQNFGAGAGVSEPFMVRAPWRASAHDADLGALVSRASPSP